MLSQKSMLLYLTTWVISTLLVMLFITLYENPKQKFPVAVLRVAENVSLRTSRENAPSINNSTASFLQFQEPFYTLDHPDTRQMQEDTGRNEEIGVPSLPVQFLIQNTDEKRINKACANLPELFHVKMNNIYWQHSHLNSGKNNIYFYAAYYDKRRGVQTKKSNSAVVRLLAMTDIRYQSQPRSLCQFWFDDLKAPMFSAKATFEYIWNITWGYDHDNFLLPVLVSCPIIGPSRRAPSVVSFVEHHCDNATTALWVEHSELFSNSVKQQNEKSKPVNLGSIAVCVKGLTFLQEDKSVRLIEWLELLKLLGAQRVFFYDLALHPKTRNTLQHYERSGFADVRPLTLPGDQLNTPELIALYFKKKITAKRLNEVIPYNDCLYRNLYRYDYLALLDIDEVILPKKQDVLTWKQLLENVVANLTNPNGISNISSYATICARNVYFFDNFMSDPSDDIPPYFHMLNHVTRAYNHTPPRQFVKCFHSVNHALVLHNHYPLRCFSKCNSRPIDLSLGQLQHYRAGCTADMVKQLCEEYMADSISDTTIWKYKEPLIHNGNSVLQNLGYFNVDFTQSFDFETLK